MSTRRLIERLPRFRRRTIVAIAVIFPFVAHATYSYWWIVQRRFLVREDIGIYLPDGRSQVPHAAPVDPPWPLGMYGEVGVPVLECWPQTCSREDFDRAKHLFPESQFEEFLAGMSVGSPDRYEPSQESWLSRRWLTVKTIVTSLLP